MIKTSLQLQPLINVLKKQDLVNVAWEVFGGIPARWEGLLQSVSRAVPGIEREAMGNFPSNKIMEAIRTRTGYLEAHPYMEPVLEAIANSPDV